MRRSSEGRPSGRLTGMWPCGFVEVTSEGARNAHGGSRVGFGWLEGRSMESPKDDERRTGGAETNNRSTSGGQCPRSVAEPHERRRALPQGDASQLPRVSTLWRAEATRTNSFVTNACLKPNALGGALTN
jgi:hypothetical protein